MNIEEILDDMDDLLDRSRPIPFAAHKAVIDADRMRELLNSAHLNIPAEIKRAKLIDSDCDRIMNEARQKAEAIIQDARNKSKADAVRAGDSPGGEKTCAGYADQGTERLK